MVYRFRVVLDTVEDVFRDIEILKTNSLEDLHNVITQSFGFDGTEMASFYVSDDEWSQGEEIVLFDMSEGVSKVRMMNETAIEDVFSQSNTKMIYVYDFLSMWTFYVELADISEQAEGVDYPNLMYVHGQLPDSPPDREFEAEDLGGDEYESEFQDDLDIDDYDNLDFDENWN
ncbi:IS1096 element passenger TnpR family protein [Croceibacter atlanticus]|uniref:IS1096 element passenger TnpR family protein n=1 Tax=Croceibacter atlanticus TaxID=313588 RepID=UPI0030F8A2B7